MTVTHSISAPRKEEGKEKEEEKEEKGRKSRKILKIRDETWDSILFYL